MHPPLCFAFVNPLGVDTSLLYKHIKSQVASLGYNCHLLKVSELLKECEGTRKNYLFSKGPSLLQDPFYGNDLCQGAKRPDYLAALLLKKIEPLWQPHQLIVVQSLKRVAEVKLFQDVFETQFFLIGLSQSYKVRKQRLKEKFKEAPFEEREKKVQEAMAQDQWGGAEDPYAQHVQKVFPAADLFFNLDDTTSIPFTFQRFLHALFNHPFTFPSLAEVTMMHAYTEKLRSGDTSRPVGAVLMGADQRLLAVGYNEVPKSGGGVYTGQETLDGRDWIMNLNTSFQAKKELFHGILSFLEETCQIDLSLAYKDEFIKRLKQRTRFMDILEYSRNIHAEMNVLTQAARYGISTQNAHLYTTTFPCHICAKHIIAAGIQEVVYIDPFAKSRAEQFFEDSLQVGGPPPTNKVHFRPYEGISPSQYTLFTSPVRENELGEKLSWTPNFKRPLQSPALLLKKIKTYQVGLPDN